MIPNRITDYGKPKVHATREIGSEKPATYQQKVQRARQRAFQELKLAHPDEYEQLLVIEMEVLGLERGGRKNKSKWA